MRIPCGSARPGRPAGNFGNPSSMQPPLGAAVIRGSRLSAPNRFPSRLEPQRFIILARATGRSGATDRPDLSSLFLRPLLSSATILANDRLKTWSPDSQARSALSPGHFFPVNMRSRFIARNVFPGEAPPCPGRIEGCKIIPSQGGRDPATGQLPPRPTLTKGFS